MIGRENVYLKNKNTRFHLTPEEVGFGLSQFSLRDTILSDSCPPEKVCTGNKDLFRSLDGSCNNLIRGSWGQSKTQFQRALHANYADGEFPLAPLYIFI